MRSNVGKVVAGAAMASVTFHVLAAAIDGTPPPIDLPPPAAAAFLGTATDVGHTMASSYEGADVDTKPIRDGGAYTTGEPIRLLTVKS
jgi:hypothetical protein